MLVMAASWSCSDIDRGNPYSDQVHTLTVSAAYPEGYTQHQRAGVEIRVENIHTGNAYTATTDRSGAGRIALADGIYRVSISDMVSRNIFNGTAENITFADGDMTLTLPLEHSTTGTIIIKEVYCGGCNKAPFEGTFQSDKYIILHNNDTEVQYLDGLCFGTLDPYNSQANNVWITKDPATGASIYPDFVPVAQCVWQFGGDGTTFPLAPGEDAVVVICGAVDHTDQYPLSVNLNKADYFVCYNNVYFWNTLYHPAPGDQIRTDHHLDVVIKTGQANAYTFSVYSPAVVIFRARETTIQEFILGEGNVVQKPGSSVDRVVKIPLDWVADAVDVFYGGSSNNSKRLPASVDAGYVTQQALYTGRTLHRRVDQAASLEAGYEVLCDTNNSSADFYERQQQSLYGL